MACFFFVFFFFWGGGAEKISKSLTISPENNPWKMFHSKYLEYVLL